MINKDNYHLIHRLSKRTVPLIKKENKFTNLLNTTSRNADANILIKNKILEGNPYMVARYGSTESSAIVNFNLKRQNLYDINFIYKHIIGTINLYWKHDNKYLNNLVTLSGFFPNEETQLERFVDLMKISTTDLDALGVWNGYEEFLEIPDHIKLFKIRELEPWFYDEPWSYALKGKKVLVIHPFEESIENQYKKRAELFKDKNILPDFELKTIKAVQTIAGEKSEFKTWFDALHHMQNQIDEIDFDVAIIGCGAYGFPLASYVKSKGKIGIHLGGVTQLLFGIKGKRWEEWPHYTALRKNNGEEWIYANEIPESYKKVENGCYW